MFEHELAQVWDLMYAEGRGKDYPGEAQLITDTIRARKPDAASLLDVGCGTGKHLGALAKRFDHVEGIDLSASMVSVAETNAPGAVLHVGDMRDFDLGRTFDAVVSLYTVVGYLPSLDALTAALRRMVAHLAPGGVLIVEPWWFTEKFLDGYVATDVVRGEDRTVARMSHTRRRGDRARMEIHYLVADDDGIRHFTESHTFSLWSRAEYLRAFADAGCAVEYVEDVLYCGMFVGGRR